VIAARSTDTVHTDAYAINWPPRSPVRVIATPETDALAGRLWGHDDGSFPREAIAEEEGRPIYLYSTDSPLRSMTGRLERLAFFAGQVAGQIERREPAAQIISRIMREAEEVLRRFEMPEALKR